MEEKRFTLRMDLDLFNEISEYAVKHRRSVAKEIEFIVAQYIHAMKLKEATTGSNIAIAAGSRFEVENALDAKYGEFESVFEQFKS